MMNIQRLIYITFIWMSSILFFTSCSSHDTLCLDGDGDVAKEGYMKIEFNLPDYAAPSMQSVQTRAMDNLAERAIDPEQLHILAFDNSANKKYLYNVPVVKNSLQYDSQDSRKATVTIKLIKTDKPINLMFIANNQPPFDKLEENVTLWGDFLKELKYSMPQNEGGNNIWNAATGKSTPFPFYGSLQVDGVNENMGKHDVVFYRALARVDVGLNFKIDANTPSGPYGEEARGLDNFKLEHVFVYRTYEEGYVAPLAPDFKTNPSIIPNLSRRDNNSPLSYSVYDIEGKALIREIYLPESDGSLSQPNINFNNKIHTLVIAGSFEGGATSYYRLDFAQDEMSKQRNFYPILRNHRYLFNVTKVLSPGFSSPQQALESAPTANLEYEMVVWDESIHEMHIKGEHYLGLDNHAIEFTSRLMGNNHVDDYVDLKYQTNYPITATDGVQLEWENHIDGDVTKSPHFDVAWNESSSSIRITKKETNVSNTIFSDVLHFKLGNFDIPIVVTQHFLDFKYTLECSSVTLHGVYRPSIALNSANDFIKLKFIAENRDMIGLEYVIETVPINGIVFKGKGLITESAMESRGGQEVTLLGSGILTTPIEHRTDPFIVTIESNSSSGSFCEVTVSPVYGKINLITHGYSANTYGYNLSGTAPANKVLNFPANFGPNDDSRVKIEGFNIIDGGNPQNRNGMSEEVKLWLTGKKKVVDPDTKITHNVMADIYHVGHNTDLATTDIPILIEFMKNGGIVILFMENDTPLSLFQQIYGKESISINSRSGSKALPLLGNEAFRLAQNKSVEEWETALVNLRRDPIFNGPFGDITEFQWGEDASSYRYVNGILENDIHTTVYSLDYTLTKASVLSSGTKGVSAFKYESDTYNLVFVGDGGFNSQTGNRAEMEGYSNLCPFYYDKQTMFPLPKLNYNPGGNIPVYNSQMFCNIFAWAVNKANSADLRAKKDKVIKEVQGK